MKKKRIIKKEVLAYFLLTTFLSLFIIMILNEQTFTLYSIIILFIIILLLGMGLFQTYKLPLHHRYGFLRHYDVVIASCIGAVITYFLSVNLNLGAVIGASAVGLAAVYVCHLSKTAKDLPPPVYCGTFVGMVSPLILPGILSVAIAGIIAGLIYYLSHDIYTGMGGKLGTIAFSGVAITILVLKLAGVLK